MAVGFLNLGPMTAAEKKTKVKTTKTWTNKAGRRCYQGNQNLVNTQSHNTVRLALLIGCFISYASFTYVFCPSDIA